MRMTEQELVDYHRRRGVTPTEKQAISAEMQALIDKANSKVPPPLEDQEQQALVNWLRIKGIRFNATPNGGYRRPTEAKRLIAQGVSAGFPDLTVWPPAGSDLPVLFIELKRQRGGTVSPAQQEWIDYLNSIHGNIRAAVCKGFAEARAFVEGEGY